MEWEGKEEEETLVWLCNSFVKLLDSVASKFTVFLYFQFYT